ncbi:MAG: hypothetical protein ACTHMT_05395 [Verrucomicrobiota bacterium]
MEKRLEFKIASEGEYLARDSENRRAQLKAEELEPAVGFEPTTEGLQNEYRARHGAELRVFSRL